MSASATTITSVTDMKAAFPAPTVNLNILHTPNLHNLVEVLIYLARCAQTHKSTISPNMNLLYVAVPPSVYAHYTNEPYPENMYPNPPRPSDAPNFIGAADNNDRESQKIAHAIDVKRYTDVQNMNTALIDTFLTLLPPQAKLAYEAIRIMNPNAVFREAFTWFLEKYGTTQAIERKQNLDNMTLPWTPTDGFDALVHRLFLASTFATCAEHPLQDHQILDAAVIVIQNCGLYPEEMKAWKKRMPVEGNDYTAFKIFWEQAIRIADKSTATPASQYDYGLNIHEINDDTTTASRTSALESTVSTFGNAYAATEERVRTQTDTINNLQGQLTNLQQMCHTIMTQPPTWTPPMNPPPPQQHYNNYHNSHQGRGGGGRGGYGGRGGQQRNNNQNFPTGPPATQVTAPHPVKRFANMNYCHTHGADIDDAHNSATCARPGPFHNYQATRNNTMGGSIRGTHKTIMPSVGGHQQPQQLGYPNGYTRGPTYPPMQMRPQKMQRYANQAPPMAPHTMPPPMAYQPQLAMTMMAPPPPMPMYQQQPMAIMPQPSPNTQFYGYNGW